MPSHHPVNVLKFPNQALILSIVLLGACGEKPTDAAVAPAPVATDTGGPNEPVQAEKLTVVNFEPATTPAGTPFNVQRDGNSGISFELSRTPVGVVKLWFDGKPMIDGVVAGVIVTSTIPVAYMATAGDYPIEIEAEGARIPAGMFTVTPR